MQEAVDMLHTMVPEQHHLSLRDQLGSRHHQLDYIIKMSTQLSIIDGTYLLLYGSFLGLISAFLNHAKYNSHGATL